jgi:hypothetical protein
MLCVFVHMVCDSVVKVVSGWKKAHTHTCSPCVTSCVTPHIKANSRGAIGPPHVTRSFYGSEWRYRHSDNYLFAATTIALAA